MYIKGKLDRQEDKFMQQIKMQVTQSELETSKEIGKDTKHIREREMKGKMQ